jgi:plasmid maintenance system killer protein
MIVSFRHKRLEHLFEKGDRRRVLPDHVDKTRRILARLEEASEVDLLRHVQAALKEF